VRNKRRFFGQIRGMLRPFGIRLGGRMGTSKFDEAARAAVRHDDLLYLSVNALLEALAFEAAIEDPARFRRSRDVGAYLGLTPRRYQSGERDVTGAISKQGDAMARHRLYEAANCLLTTWGGRSALKSWGVRLLKRVGPKRARVAVARKLACLLLRLWKDGSHYREGEMRMA